ncbi:MAG TPA: GAF domain-containing protein [Thermoanaerobaculia bacterium]
MTNEPVPQAVRERLAVLEQQIASLSRAGAHGGGQPLPDMTPVAIQLILREMKQVVPYDSCSVQQLRGTRLVIIGGVGFADLDVVLGESFEINNLEIPNGEVIYRRRPVVVGDTEQYRAFRRGLHVGAGIHSWLGVPLLRGEDLLGMLALDKAEKDFYTVEHQRHALAFAGLVAGAMG